MIWKRIAMIAVGIAIVAGGQVEGGLQSHEADISSTSDAKSILDQYCVTCHNDRLKTGGFSLETIDLDKVNVNAEHLEKVVKKLRLGAMPPAGMPRPDDATYTSLMSWLESELDHIGTTHLNAGRTETLHRLNRTEYGNVIRDLLHIEGLDFSVMLPTDDASYGFDNIAGVLGMSPTHLERYLNAARVISRTAIGDVEMPTGGETLLIHPGLSQDDQLETLPLGSRGGTMLSRYFPVDGEYIIRFQAHTGTGISAEEEPNYIELTIDGERIFFEEMTQNPVAHTGSGSDVDASTDWEVRTPIKAGFRDIGVTFVATTHAQAEDILQPYLRPPGISAFKLTRMGGYRGPYVAQLSYTGPFNATVATGPTPSRERIFVCEPPSRADVEKSVSGQIESGVYPEMIRNQELPCAKQILSTLARRAYRRPVTDADITPLLQFFSMGSADAGFDKGIQLALERILSSPEFLFRIQRDPENVAPNTAYQIGSLELASRLSFFLWSSIPDDELIDTASQGEGLHDQEVLEHQVRRMLADPRADALVTNFVGQWLRLRNVAGTNPNTRLFMDYDETLRRALKRETELFVESIMREDRSVLDLLNADYTFVNERLARHYGIPNIYGSRFRRVQVTDENRQGILGHGSILTVTSQANRTSPVVRGKFILDNFLGAPPPPPPPDVPALEETQLQGTLRQRMEQHRENPVCASCHKVIDPMGFPLENFDAVGAWRHEEAGMTIDAAGIMPDGTEFQGVAGLREVLSGKASGLFIATLTERLMTYALGRGVEFYDAPALRKITRNVTDQQYKFSSLILSVVNSVPFQMRQSEPSDETLESTVATR